MKTFTDQQIQELFSILSETLNKIDIDTQLDVLNGLKKRLDIQLKDNFRVFCENELVFRASDKTPTFFYQDYLAHKDFESYKVEEVYVAPLMFDDTFVEITENKSAYVFATILFNEIKRCEMLKKGTWKGKIHRITKPIELTPKQEADVLKTFNNSDFKEDVSISIFLDMVKQQNLTTLYKKRQSKKCCILLRELTKHLGDEWGQSAVYNTTHGEKTLEYVKKCYASNENKEVKNCSPKSL